LRRLALAVVLLSGCAATAPHPGVSEAPAQPWTPPANVVPPPAPVAATKLELPAGYTPGSPITLSQIVDIALANNPDTRTAWLQARAAEADLGSARSDYLPEVDLNASVVTSRDGGTSFGPSIAVSYLLFDFGGRDAFVEQARQALINADFLHNQAIQDVVLRTQTAYYSYLDAKALLAAQEATIKERQTLLDAAEARHRAGVATIADVLQARTALSQATLDRDTFAGQMRTIEGLLATTMGLPATTAFDFGELPLDVPARAVTESIETLITQAVQQRPDLAAARARAEGAEARVRQVRSAYLPSVAASSSVGFTQNGTRDSDVPYTAGISLRFPFFTGFRNVYDVRAAQRRAEVAQEDVRRYEQDVNLQVWTSYYALQTATTRLTTVRDLLASARQSAEVASERYKAGVGNILDLLTAESALESARAQEVQARTDWFVAVAQLAHDTGSLK